MNVVRQFYFLGDIAIYDDDRNLTNKEYDDQFTTKVLRMEIEVDTDNIKSVLGSDVRRGKEISMPKNFDLMRASQLVYEDEILTVYKSKIS